MPSGLSNRQRHPGHARRRSFRGSVTWLRRRLSLPDETPTSVVLAIAFYLCHLFCAGWVASSECFSAFAMMAFLYALYSKQVRPSFHILYFPLVVYAIASTVSAFV